MCDEKKEITFEFGVEVESIKKQKGSTEVY